MGLIHRLFLDEEGYSKVYACTECKTHLTHADCLVSKAFTGHLGKAWLFREVYNVHLGPSCNRNMTTGLHTVKDLTCRNCRNVVGWKYEKAFEEQQKYKEGKFILEKTLLYEVTA
ncbi:Yippee/Mis18 [Chytridium lagenaria]|nr:Yippee/Mis18 [Chytridium lagenaria]